MSVINRMLAELDARRANKPAVAGAAVSAHSTLPAKGSSRRLPIIILLGVAAIAAVAFGNWPALVGAAPAQGPRPVEAAVSGNTEAVPSAAAAAGAIPAEPGLIEGPGLKLPATRVASAAPAMPRIDAIPAVVPDAAPIAAPMPPRLRAPELALPLHTGAVEKKLIAMTAAQRATLAYRQAADYAASGHSSQSIDKALEALKADPDHLAARQLVAVLLYEKSRHEEAGAVLREGLLRKPGQPQLAYLLARLQVEAGDHTSALAVLAQAEGLSADGHGLRAGVLAQLGRYGDALKSYEAAVRLDPDNAAWWLGLGVALDAEGQSALARQAFQRARAIGSLRGDVLAYIDQKLAQ